MVKNYKGSDCKQSLHFLICYKNTPVIIQLILLLCPFHQSAFRLFNWLTCNTSLVSLSLLFIIQEIFKHDFSICVISVTRPTTGHIRLCLQIHFYEVESIAIHRFFLDLVVSANKGNTAPFYQKDKKPPMYLTIRSETSYSLHLHSLAKVWLSHNGYKSRGYLDRCFLLCYIWSKLGTISLRFIFFLYFWFIWLLNLKNLLKNSTEIIWIH